MSRIEKPIVAPEIMETQQQNCEHRHEVNTILPRILEAKIKGTQERVQTKLLEYHHNRLKCGVSVQTQCPQTIDCQLCFYIDCEYQVCLTSVTSTRGGTINHFIEKGHSIGYSVKYGSCKSLYCFKCNEIMPVFINSEIDKRNVDGNAVTRTASHSQLERKRKKMETGVDLTVCCRGLYNFGLTCYINCVIQVLVHTSQVTNFFFKNKRKLSLRKYFSDSEKEPSFISVFQELLLEFQKYAPEPLVPSRLLHAIYKKMPNFGGSRQHDAHEFFISILNIIHQEFIRAKENNTIIDQTFLGRLQSKVTCKVCLHSRYTDDPFFDVALEVITEKSKGISIQLCDLLQEFTRLEHLDDSNLLHCTICARKTKSTKQLSFKVLPKVLCLQLKRFRHNPQSRSTVIKISTKLCIPECVDFSSYKTARIFQKGQELSENEKEDCSPYKLYAIVSHIGKSPASGHYRTYIRKSQDWFLFDDQTVKKMPSAKVLECEGYLLFYERCQNS